MAANQQQLPDEQTAYETIIETVDKRAFFHKMAQLGIVPETAEEAASLYNLSFKVAELAEQRDADPFVAPQTKTGSDRFAEAHTALDKMAGAASPPSNEASEAALAFAQDPGIYASTLVLKHAEAVAAASEAEITAA